MLNKKAYSAINLKVCRNAQMGIRMNDNNCPLISIIIPVYNTDKEQFKKCIGSVCNQSLENIEIIIVDDGSDEEHRKIIDNAAKEDGRLKVIHKANGGVSSARNMGLNDALADYIMFVDSDDWIDKKCCEKAYKSALSENADIVMWRYVKEYEGSSVEVQVFPESGLRFDYWKEQFNPFDMRLMGMCWMKLYKKTVINKVRFNEELTNGEDVEFNFRVFERMVSAVYINEPFYHYRQNNTSAVRRYIKDMPDRYKKTLDIIEQDVIKAKRLKKHLAKAYYSFTAISYLVLNMNYIFAEENKSSVYEKIEQLKKLSGEKPYSTAISRAEQLELPITRKMSLIFAKYKFYWGIYIIIMVKLHITRFKNK